ncbi:transmembrane protein 135-like isoform X2 [Ruditapes philippinarum]|uniref:transmembrane protein 135-like isoform X2 n=1 Tax=Ruditapes philippinarum TaxID=129788 RepID=UPI00295C229A|nr:transmembrane protein 135-like isoform X2 [Ruditapes philippinarum]
MRVEDKMVVISKPILLDYTCYELGHTWTPSCKKASFDVFLLVFKEALKIYGSVYFIAGLVRRRGKAYFRKKFWLELLQSSFFLTTNGTLFITCFCLWRKITGFYFYPCAIVVGAPASGISLCIERKERRGLLAVYMANVAVETIWRMLKARGWVKSLPHGEVLVFSLAAAGYLYYFKKAGGLPDGTLSILKKIFGSAEMSGVEEVVPNDMDGEVIDINRNGPHHNHTSTTANQKRSYGPVVRWLRQCPKHYLCKHGHGCVYYVLEGSVKMFGIGYALQGAVKLVSSISRVFKQPKSVIKSLVHINNFQLGAFLASFVGIYRVLNCLLRWLREKDEALHGLVAGFVAGWSMLFYKSQTVALYTALKLSEMLYFKGIASGSVPYIKCADIIIYSISTAIVFHAAVIEPHNLRPAYWNFLLRVTGNKFAGMNRKLLDPWVPNCSKLFPDFWPDYDYRFTNLRKP